MGVVLKNPLKGVPLLMTNLCLVWDATPAKYTTPSSLSPSASAVCEVVKRVLLQPEEERMVRDVLDTLNCIKGTGECTVL